MDTIVLKFGGSSVADNIKLNVVAEKIINLKDVSFSSFVIQACQYALDNLDEKEDTHK